jgi:excisionase family DNA binding protein
MGAKLLLTVGDVARELSLGETTVRELIARGELRAIRIGRALRVRAQDLEAFVAGLGEPAPAPLPLCRRA